MASQAEFPYSAGNGSDSSKRLSLSAGSLVSFTRTRTRQSKKVRDDAREALLLSRATSQAMVAAQSILLSGGSQATALSTAKAAAQSILLDVHENLLFTDDNEPSSSDNDVTGSANNKSFIGRRKAKRQAEIISSMALLSVNNSLQNHPICSSVTTGDQISTTSSHHRLGHGDAASMLINPQYNSYLINGHHQARMENLRPMTNLVDKGGIANNSSLHIKKESSTSPRGFARPPEGEVYFDDAPASSLLNHMQSAVSQSHSNRSQNGRKNQLGMERQTSSQREHCLEEKPNLSSNWLRSSISQGAKNLSGNKGVKPQKEKVSGRQNGDSIVQTIGPSLPPPLLPSRMPYNHSRNVNGASFAPEEDPIYFTTTRGASRRRGMLQLSPVHSTSCSDDGETRESATYGGTVDGSSIGGTYDGAETAAQETVLHSVHTSMSPNYSNTYFMSIFDCGIPATSSRNDQAYTKNPVLAQNTLHESRHGLADSFNGDGEQTNFSDEETDEETEAREDTRSRIQRKGVDRARADSPSSAESSEIFRELNVASSDDATFESSCISTKESSVRSPRKAAHETMEQAVLRALAARDTTFRSNGRDQEVNCNINTNDDPFLRSRFGRRREVSSTIHPNSGPTFPKNVSLKADSSPAVTSTFARKQLIPLQKWVSSRLKSKQAIEGVPTSNNYFNSHE
jgi:hypothetical protein